MNKECKMVYLNPELKAEQMINEYLDDGWELLNIVSSNHMGGTMVGVFLREKSF